MLDKLSLFPLLDELSPTGRARLLAATRHLTLQPYAQVLQRGDEVAGAYLVERGALRVYYVSAEGREGTLYWIDPGQSCILALNCLFARLAYPAWVEVDSSETQVAVISGDAYRELFSAEAAVQRFTFDALATRLFDLMSLMQETASLGLEQRVAAHLLPTGLFQIHHHMIICRMDLSGSHQLIFMPQPNSLEEAPSVLAHVLRRIA